MARINIEDSLWADQRFIQLCIKTGDMAKAVGAVLLAFKLAQRFWVPDQRNIPSVQFRSTPLASDLIEVGLAEYFDNEQFVYVKGTKEQFGWLIQRSQAGKAKKPRPLKSLDNSLNGIERDLSGSNGIERNETSYSSSYSPSSSSSYSKEEFKSYSEVPVSDVPSSRPDQKKPLKPKEPPNPLNKQTWESYEKGYLRRYGVSPVRNAKVNGQIANLVKRLGVEAPAVAAFYLTHNNSWYTQKAHSVDGLLADAEALRTQMATGRQVNQNSARDVERQQNNAKVFEKFLNPEGETNEGSD